jgi:hypothetical protein
MKSLIIGLVVLAAAAFAALPREVFGFGLGWWNDVVIFLRGALPVIAGIIALILVSIGIFEIMRKPGRKAAVNI